MSVLPDEDAPPPAAESAPVPQPRVTRLRAAGEVLLCSEFPTQFAIGALLGRAGISPLEPSGALSERFLYLVSGIDTIVLLALIWLLMRLSGERARHVFFRRGTPAREVMVGFALVPLVFSLVVSLQLTINAAAPSLRNVPDNPFESMIQSPLQVVSFVVLVLVAGGVREELQRAFLLHRFDQALGGAWFGVVATSAAFGLGHVVQGWDAVVITAALGALWGVLYVARRNAIPGIVSHALFNAGQVLLAVTTLDGGIPA